MACDGANIAGGGVQLLVVQHFSNDWGSHISHRQNTSCVSPMFLRYDACTLVLLPSVPEGV